VHRDLKPSNILIASIAGMDWVYVLDFGISDIEDTTCQDTEKTTSGSLCYLAPEQVCQHTYTKRSDIYQLSLILFECLAGRLPFEISFAGAIMYRLAGPVLPSDSELRPVVIPWNLRFVLEKGLARDPADRYNSMYSFSRELYQVLSRMTKAA
ncbi:MAG: protein kinase, partial [Candidatus Melainabacteria bacterium]|nr:protein kinase [Candidatus Melainabacteria bacterium]